MCKLIYSMTVSLDGYISGPQGEGDWTRYRTRSYIGSTTTRCVSSVGISSDGDSMRS